MELQDKDRNLILIVSFLIALAILLVLSPTLLSFIVGKQAADQSISFLLNKSNAQNVSKQLENLMPPIVKQIFTPPKSQEEIAEESYLENSYLVNENFTTAFFETRLIRVGFFRKVDIGANTARDIFRADFYVKNTERDSHNFYVDEGYVWYNLDNFTATDNNFTSNSVEPGEERYAYAIFGTVPRSITSETLITIGTTRAYSPIFNKIIVVPYNFNVSLPLLARPRTSLG